MCGPLGVPGGVATHTKNLTESLLKYGVNINLFNLWGKNIERTKASPFRRVYQRTLGLFLHAIKKKRDYEIIHIQTSSGIFSFIAAITGVIIAMVCKKHLVITFHSSQIKHKKAFAFVLKYSDLFILVSKKQKENILQFFPQFSNKIVIIYNGFCASLFYPRVQQECRKELDLPYEKKIILCVSNLLKIKGHKYLIEAIKFIINIRNDVLCIIIGDGPLKRLLQKQINELGLKNYIMLAGSKSINEIPLWLNASDVFVLPSLAEGNPVVMFECLGCGKPFVGTKVGGIPEVIVSDEYGLLCEPANSENLAEKILIALEKKWRREKIIKYAEQFTWEKIAQNMMEIYENTIKSRNKLDHEQENM